MVELTNLLRRQVACASSSELVDLIRGDVSRTRALLGQTAGMAGTAEAGPVPGMVVGRVASTVAEVTSGPICAGPRKSLAGQD